MTLTPPSTTALDLVISRHIRAPRSAIWRAWTEPDLFIEWWCPKPWTTELIACDMKAGGAFHTLMHGPDGESSDNPGCFLEVVPAERLTFTSTLTAGYRPGASWIAITVVFTLADEGDGTRYIATVMHADEASRQKHEEMGFYDGWNTAIDQLEAVAQRLS